MIQQDSKADIQDSVFLLLMFKKFCCLQANVHCNSSLVPIFLFLAYKNISVSTKFFILIFQYLKTSKESLLSNQLLNECVHYTKNYYSKSKDLIQFGYFY